MYAMWNLGAINMCEILQPDWILHYISFHSK